MHRQQDVPHLVPYSSTSTFQLNGNANELQVHDERMDTIHCNTNGTQSRSPSNGLKFDFRRIWSQYDIGNCILLISLLILYIVIQSAPTHHRLIVNLSSPDINYPLLHETVPLWLLVILAFLLPVGIILAVYFFSPRSTRTICQLYVVLFGWALSMLLTLILTDFLKRVSGRPRPNFIQLSGYVSQSNMYTASSSDIANAYQSFPSGHASSSFSGLGYISIYLFRTIHPSKFDSRDHARTYHSNQGWKSLLCIAPIFFATWIALTRITDYWHNFDDCALGAFIGLTMAALVFEIHVSWWFAVHTTPTTNSRSELNQRVSSCDLESNIQRQTNELTTDNNTISVTNEGHLSFSPHSEAPLLESNKYEVQPHSRSVETMV